MELQRIFGANVRNYRRAAGWTLEGLAAEVGVSRETIGKIERGTAAPLFDTVEKIAHALSITPVELFGASPTPPGNRGKLLLRIHTKLADMNDRQLGQISKIMDVLS
jgi:transcriptional regulator with XRE-family HTH domain